MNRIYGQIEDADRALVQALETRLELEIRRKRMNRLAPQLGRQIAPTQDEKKSCSALPIRHRMLGEPFAEMLSRQIEREADDLIKERGQLVGFQGARGAFSDVATRELVRGGLPMPNLSFADVFQGVDNGSYDFGVVPVENSLEGAVTEVNDLLTKTELKVIGETILKIEHCLLVAPGTRLAEVRVAYSHPQALAQCRGFLQHRGIEARPYFDTAGAAQMIARDRPKAACAIGSSLSGGLYGLEIAAREIADNQRNSTRFLLLSRSIHEGKGDKCSIVFATDHSAGALFKVLSLFANASINLTRIASMPRRNDPGNYDFFLDFEGSDSDEAVAGVLENVSDCTISLRFLGCYPTG